MWPHKGFTGRYEIAVHWMVPETDVRPSVSRRGPDTPAGVQRTHSYVDHDRVVFYDAEAPLAWLRSDRTCRLADRR
jgi:hypothetical protein